jgi:septal ring factor EnvC (AmiA/AmiB activator)
VMPRTRRRLSLSGNVWSAWSAKSGWRNKRCIPMAKNNDKPTTIDDLARMINAGFNDVTNDIGEVKQDMAEVKQRLDTLDARVGRIEADVHALRDEMVHRRECEDVLDRVKYIEKKLGIESGV